MPRYVALLRAINVGGHIVKMDRLRRLFEELGLQRVETLIASGNVLFDSPGRSTDRLETTIEAHLETSLGYPVTTFVRPLSELAAVATSHPFADAERDAYSLYVGFLKAAPASDVARTLAERQTDVDALHLNEREVYWLCRIRSAESTLSGAVFERVLGGPATFRNITTVRKLAAKADASPPASRKPRPTR